MIDEYNIGFGVIAQYRLIATRVRISIQTKKKQNTVLRVRIFCTRTQQKYHNSQLIDSFPAFNSPLKWLDLPISPTHRAHKVSSIEKKMENQQKMNRVSLIK